MSHKGFKYLLADEQDSNNLTGYIHNAVTPFFMNDDKMMIILSEDVTKLEPAYIWLGGGRTSLKIGLSVKDFLSYFGKRVIIAKTN